MRACFVIASFAHGLLETHIRFVRLVQYVCVYTIDVERGIAVNDYTLLCSIRVNFYQ